MKYTKRITTALATGAILVNALAPMAFAETLTVSGNGAFSNSAVNVSQNTASVVNQSNNANISNNVTSKASTGGNSSDFNTGGDTFIKTGNATTNTTLNTQANLNQASLTNCATCNGGATNVTVSGNGAYSDNGVGVNNTNSVFLNQANDANINNNVDAKASTGKNDTSYNTGGGSIVLTGNATTNTAINNKANANFANVGGSNGSLGGSSVTIDGNGAFSTTGVGLNQSSAVVLGQDNAANINNNVDAKAKTGDNGATFNTGNGTSGISTGNATTGVTVDNAANFNSAELSCDCVLGDLGVKVAGNGADSMNSVDAAADNSVFDGQNNAANLANGIDGDSKTGSNDTGFGTTGFHGDPSIYTGDSVSTTNANNAGNVNLLDNGTSLTLPGNWNMGVTFDMSSLWASMSHAWTM